MGRSFAIRFLDQSLVVEAPESVAGDIAAFFRLTAEGGDADATALSAVVTEASPGRYALEHDGKRLAADCPRGDLLHRLNDVAGRDLAFTRRGIPLDAAAVGWEGKTVLIIGQAGSGKSSLAAWFIEQGFSYIADFDVSILDDAGTIAGFAGPLTFPQHPISHVGAMPTFRNLASVAGGKDRLMIRPEPGWQASDTEQPCGLIVLVDFKQGADLRFEVVPKDEAPLRLLEATRKVVIPSDPQYPAGSETGRGRAHPAARLRRLRADRGRSRLPRSRHLRQRIHAGRIRALPCRPPAPGRDNRRQDLPDPCPHRTDAEPQAHNRHGDL